MEKGKWVVWSSLKGMEVDFGTREDAMEFYHQIKDESETTLLLKVQDASRSNQVT